jgi:hypothetical protein
MGRQVEFCEIDEARVKNLVEDIWLSRLQVKLARAINENYPPGADTFDFGVYRNGKYVVLSDNYHGKSYYFYPKYIKNVEGSEYCDYVLDLEIGSSFFEISIPTTWTSADHVVASFLQMAALRYRGNDGQSA